MPAKRIASKNPKTYTDEVNEDVRVTLPRVSMSGAGLEIPPSTSAGPSSTSFPSGSSSSSSSTSLPPVDLPYVSCVCLIGCVFVF